MAEKGLATGSPLQTQFACHDWLPPWYFLHAAGCQRAEKDLAAGSPLQAQLYVTGCRLGTFCMRLAAAICLHLTHILNARGRVCQAAKKVGTLCSRQCCESGIQCFLFDLWIWDPV
jgi:hypothetical protein